MELFSQSIETPLGTMIVCSTEKGVCFLEFDDRKEYDFQIASLTKSLGKGISEKSNNHIELLRSELDVYFKGELQQFTTPLDIVGTEFQKQVWNELQKIPYGKTMSYQEQANNMSNPKSVRAVASANGKNRIAIIIPCHRVIGSNGTLTGYAGGLARKRWLLNLENQEKNLFN